MWRRTIALLSMLAVTAAVMLVSPAVAQADDEELYTACNLWYEEPMRMWSVGYKKGQIIPAGTKVTDIQVKKKWTKKYIIFVNADTGVEHGILWIPKHNPGITIDDLMARLFTPKTRSQLLAGLTAAEKSAIDKGEVKPGMSRRAVLVSHGRPPEVGTTSLESNAWKYWRDRFRTFIVNFEGDKVANIVD